MSSDAVICSPEQLDHIAQEARATAQVIVDLHRCLSNLNVLVVDLARCGDDKAKSTANAHVTHALFAAETAFPGSSAALALRQISSKLS